MHAHHTRPDIYLKELASNVSVLYVEDDKEVQTALANIFKRFFTDVDLALNGQEGLKKMREKSYDLVVTDINMPIMDGIEMVQQGIKEKLLNKVLVISAHNEFDKVITLINLGVDGCVNKPVDLTQLLNQLVYICEPIQERKMLDHYIKELENANQELSLLNQQLDVMLSSVESHPNKDEIKETLSHIGQPELHHTPKVERKNHNPHAISAEDFHQSYPIELGRKNEELENIEDDYDMLLSKYSGTYTTDLLQQLTAIMEHYSQTIEAIPHFQPLAIGIEELSRTFASIDDPSIMERLMPMISSLFDTLHRWRVSVFVKRDAENIHYLDESIISDAHALKGMLGLSEHTHNGSEAEFDLF